MKVFCSCGEVLNIIDNENEIITVESCEKCEKSGYESGYGDALFQAGFGK